MNGQQISRPKIIVFTFLSLNQHVQDELSNTKDFLSPDITLESSYTHTLSDFSPNRFPLRSKTAITSMVGVHRKCAVQRCILVQKGLPYILRTFKSMSSYSWQLPSCVHKQKTKNMCPPASSVCFRKSCNWCLWQQHALMHNPWT